MACSTLLWIGGAVSVGGADEYEQMMGKVGEGFIFDKTANDGICLEGCQLARAASGIALAGGLVAMLLQCYRCAKSCDSGDEQTVSASPMNEKREPAVPAAEAEEARLATQAEEERPAPVERPGFMGKLAWYLFGEEEPAAESEKREPAAPPIIVNSWPISPADSPREEPDEAATAPESLETRASAKAKAAETAERPGFTRKLSSFLFGEQEQVAESEGVVVEEEEAMGEQGELAPEGVVVEAEAMWEQEELEPEC